MTVAEAQTSTPLPSRPSRLSLIEHLKVDFFADFIQIRREMTNFASPKNPRRESVSDRLRRLGERLRDQRRQRGWTQSGLSSRTRIGTQRISRIENGRCEPSIEEILRLAVVYDATLEELLLGAPLPRRGPHGFLARDLQTIAELGYPEEIAALARVFELLSNGLRALRSGSAAS